MVRDLGALTSRGIRLCEVSASPEGGLLHDLTTATFVVFDEMFVVELRTDT